MTLLEAFRQMATEAERAAIDAAMQGGAFEPYNIVWTDSPQTEADRRLAKLERGATEAFAAIAERVISGATEITGIHKHTGREEPVPRRLLRRVDEISWRDNSLGFFTDIEVILPPVVPPPPPSPPPPAPPRGGRRPAYDWAMVEKKLLAKLTEDGAPAPWDGGQAELERFVAGLFPANKCPSEPRIRVWVKRTIEKYRRTLA